MPHAQVQAQPDTGSARNLLAYLAFAFGISLILASCYVFKHRAFAFVDIGIDLFSYYYPIQIIQAQQLREIHTLAWSFQLGLGGYIGSVFNPTQLATAWLPEAWQLAIRLPTYFLKLIIAGTFFFGYLRKIRFEPHYAVIGALAFTFGSYSIVNGQWDTEGHEILQFAAYLFFFESFFRSGTSWYAVAAGFTVGFGYAFGTYSFSLLTLLYTCIRPAFVSKERNCGPFLPSLARYGCFAALGFLLTAAVQIPNLLYLLDSPRVSGDYSKFAALIGKLTELNSRKVIGAEVAGMFGKDLLGTASLYRGYSNYFEAPGFYVGMLMLVCIPQLLGPVAKHRERLICIAGLTLLVLYMVWPAMRYAVYGFGHTAFRLSTLWVSSGILVLGLAGLRRASLSGVWRAGLLTSGIGIVTVLLAVSWRLQQTVVVEHVALVIAFIGVYCIALWPSGKGIPIRILTCVFACELLLFSVPALMQRDAVGTDGTSKHGTYSDGTEAALAAIRQMDDSPDFYRIEKTYRSVFLNDALVQGYSGTKSYWFHGGSITRFVDKLHLPRPHPRTNYIGSMVDRPDIIALLGVKYVLSRDRKPDKKADLVHVARAGDIHIYRNTAAHGVAHLYSAVSGEDAVSRLPLDKRDAHLLDHVVVADPAEIRSRLAQLDKGQTAVAPNHDLVSLLKISDVHLQADVVSRRAGVLLITMPFDSGWKAWVDGTGATLFRADYGLTALLLPAGNHKVSLRYTVPGRILGIWLSLAALAILMGLALLHVVSTRHQRQINRD